MMKGLIIAGLAFLMLAIFIALLIVNNKQESKSSEIAPEITPQQESSQKGNFATEAIKKSLEVKMEADFRQVEVGLEIYRAQNSMYPNFGSYSEMIRELINLNMVEPSLEKPSSNYHYLYCSSNGNEFNLKAGRDNKTILSKGTDLCEAGE